MTSDISVALIDSFNNAILGIMSFVPKLIAGSLIIIIGIIVASLLKQVVIGILKVLRFESLLQKYGVPEAQNELNWSNILGEIVRWFAIIVFLIPTADVWGLPQIVAVLNKVLFYLPNVFVAAIIALVGFVLARLSHDIVYHLSRGVSPETSRAIASVTHWSVTIFVVLAVLNQLGVASDLIRILFTGIVAMLALAGGIAFGLGGQSVAKDILETLKKKLK